MLFFSDPFLSNISFLYTLKWNTGVNKMGYFQWLVSPVKNIQLIWNLTNYLKLSCFLQVYTEGYLEPSLKINFLF